MEFRPLPIGIDDFKEIVSRGYYYVDKTWFIKELLDMKGKVNLFTRPRRFGKTLNLSKAPVILELKIADTFKGMEASCDLALKQIEDRQYNNWLPEEGYTEVLDYGIAFYKKQCQVKVVRRFF